MYLEIVISYKQSSWLIHKMSNKLLVLIDVKLVIYTKAAPDISVEYNNSLKYFLTAWESLLLNGHQVAPYCCLNYTPPPPPPPRKFKAIKLTHSIKDQMLAISYLINIFSSISIPAFIGFDGDFQMIFQKLMIFVGTWFLF